MTAEQIKSHHVTVMIEMWKLMMYQEFSRYGISAGMSNLDMLEIHGMLLDYLPEVYHD